jgi:hypothetical protein
VRSRDDAANKGREAAAACLETALTLSAIRAMAREPETAKSAAKSAGAAS